MATNESPRQILTSDGIAMLLQTGNCPVRYRCLAMDCMECLQMYIDQGGNQNGESE